MYRSFENAPVSIHASVKDATIPSPSSYLKSKVSIHASVKDATHADDVPDPDKDVSIHASVKDATIRLTDAQKTQVGFNPRICKRCDKGFHNPTLTTFTFQSTHL